MGNCRSTTVGMPTSCPRTSTVESPRASARWHPSLHNNGHDNNFVQDLQRNLHCECQPRAVLVSMRSGKLTAGTCTGWAIRRRPRAIRSGHGPSVDDHGPSVDEAIRRRPWAICKQTTLGHLQTTTKASACRRPRFVKEHDITKDGCRWRNQRNGRDEACCYRLSCVRHEQRTRSSQQLLDGLARQVYRTDDSEMVMLEYTRDPLSICFTPLDLQRMSV